MKRSRGKAAGFWILLSFSATALLWAGTGQRLQFSDVAAKAGLRADIQCGGPEKRWITEANGTGLAWLDYDNDGLMDLLIVNGGTMDQLRKTLAGENLQPTRDGVYLYHNLGAGRFEDVTEKTGLANPYWGTGANAADYNNDGFTDILITTIGRDLLFKNNGDGTFSNVSKAAGLGQDVAWHTGSAFGDFTGTGKLDLFITGYVDIHSLSFAEPAPVCVNGDLRTFCGPIGLKGEHAVLYRNNGDGTFADVTKSSGIGSAPAAHGFTAVTGDFDKDGTLDIFVANDSDPNFLFLNQGHGTFKESALEHGIAFNADGRVQSNMGVAVGEYARSGTMDLLTTTFQKDYFPLFRPNKSGIYEEISTSAGLADATSRYLGWACGLADFGNTGRREFWTANGHVYPAEKDYFEPVTIFGDEGGRSSLVYSFPTKPDNSYRGGAMADFDNDGKMDLAILPISGSPVLLRNETQSGNLWVGITLRGTRSNRDGIGANVTVEACGQKQVDSVHSGGSYLSRNDPRLHFGLGSCGKIDRLTVQWPSGSTSTVTNPKLARYMTIEESK